MNWENIVHWGKCKEPSNLIRQCARLKIKIQILVVAKRLWGHSKSMFTQNFQLHRYISTITRIKIFTCSYIKNSFKKCLRLSSKTFSNYQETYQNKLYLLFEKSDNFFHRVSIEIGLTPPLSLFVLIRSLRTPSPSFTTHPLLKRVRWKRWKELIILLCIHASKYKNK